jgi:hypothetical protein
MFTGVGWLLVAEFSGKHIGPIFDGQSLQEQFLTLENGTDVLSRNTCNELPTYASKHLRLFGLLDLWILEPAYRPETSVTN